MTEEQNEFLNIIVEEVLASGVEDLRQMFLLMPKDELLVKYHQEGYELFQEFKFLILEQFGNSDEEYLTIELISRIYEAVKWLN